MVNSSFQLDIHFLDAREIATLDQAVNYLKELHPGDSAPRHGGEQQAVDGQAHQQCWTITDSGDQEAQGCRHEP